MTVSPTARHGRLRPTRRRAASPADLPGRIMRADVLPLVGRLRTGRPPLLFALRRACCLTSASLATSSAGGVLSQLPSRFPRLAAPQDPAIAALDRSIGGQLAAFGEACAAVLASLARCCGPELDCK